VQLAQRRLFSVSPGSTGRRQRPLPAMGAQPGRAPGEQERRFAGSLAFDHDAGHGGVLQPTRIGTATKIEAAEMFRDRGPQRVVELERLHAADGRLKVQSTAGGTLRQMRRPWTPTSRRLWRSARGNRRRRAIGKLDERRSPRQSLEHAVHDAVHDLRRQREERQARHHGGNWRGRVIGQQSRRRAASPSMIF
jgi:hypothetical protein